MSQSLTIDQAMVIATQHHLAGRVGDAEAIYRQILQIAPNHPHALHNLGEIAFRVRKYDISIDLVSRAIAAFPNDATFHNTLAASLFAANRADESFAACQRALQLNPNLSHAYGNLGNCLAERGDFRGSVTAFERALQLDPNNAIAHDGLGLSLLRLGDLQRGWREQEWRWHKPGFEARRFSDRKHWDGGSLAGRKILIYIEQGFGDVFQFCRYIPLLADRGAQVWLETVAEIKPLMETLRGVAGLVIAGETPPPVDLVCPLMSMAHLYGTTLQTVPAQVPYLSASPELVAAWVDYFKADSNLKVGIAWAGRASYSNDFNRSTTLETFAALADVPGVTLYSLQRHEASSPLALPAGMKLIDLSDRLPDFNARAAAIAALDLVIAVDTSMVHLAGALGQQVWTLCPSDWRWLEVREDSPWYPTMRLFRARKRNDWTGVMERVVDALREKVALRCGSGQGVTGLRC